MPLCRSSGLWTNGTTSYRVAAENLAKEVARLADFKPTDRVMDVGCGHADCTMLFVDQFCGSTYSLAPDATPTVRCNIALSLAHSRVFSCATQSALKAQAPTFVGVNITESQVQAAQKCVINFFLSRSHSRDVVFMFSAAFHHVSAWLQAN